MFNNYENWLKGRESTLFRNEKQMNSYQNFFLKKLKKNKRKFEPIELISSGSTNNIPKKYTFPKFLFKLIENHHIWRIMDSHGIKEGKSLKIFQLASPQSNEIMGPKIIPQMGLSNESWELWYRPEESNDVFWKNINKKIKDLNPNFLYTSPSSFISMSEFLQFDFDFPVIFSCESLSDPVRVKAKKFFTNAIDKMRDWTTGFGFFECPYGNKHIYDELCISKSIGSSIICTDLFNYCENFIEKTSDDEGTIEKINCDCGIYGNILRNFEGKVFECLVSLDGTKYSSNFISNFIMKLNIKISNYQIIQDKNKNIIIKISNDLNAEEAFKVADHLGGLILERNLEKNKYKEASILYEKEVIHAGKSDFTIAIERSPMELRRNKMISVRSHAIS